MVNDIKTIMDSFEVEWRCVDYGAVSRIIFAVPYEQLEVQGSGTGFIDSYYTVSNSTYHLKKKISACLAENGFEVKREVTIQYKILAAHAGFGVALRSSLIANPRFGTRMALEAIELEGSHGEAPLEIAANTLCQSCRLCEKACPAQCIGEELDWRRCLRNLQNSGFVEDEKAAAAMENRVLGCDVCQRVCPMNAHLGMMHPQGETAELLKLENIFAACAGGKKALGKYADLLGGNYLRPSKLLALTINAMTNAEDMQKYAPLVETVRGHSDERVRLAAERFFRKAALL